MYSLGISLSPGRPNTAHHRGGHDLTHSGWYVRRRLPGARYSSIGVRPHERAALKVKEVEEDEGEGAAEQEKQQLRQVGHFKEL